MDWSQMEWEWKGGRHSHRSPLSSFDMRCPPDGEIMGVGGVPAEKQGPDIQSLMGILPSRVVPYKERTSPVDRAVGGQPVREGSTACLGPT
eukprot:scaffold34093_cov59-Attheya_sp.AAC.1